MYFCHLCLAFASLSAMLFRRTRRMVLVLLVVLQGGLLDGQLAVPPLVARCFSSLVVELQEDSAKKRKELLLPTSTQLTFAFKELKRCGSTEGYSPAHEEVAELCVIWKLVESIACQKGSAEKCGSSFWWYISSCWSNQRHSIWETHVRGSEGQQHRWHHRSLCWARCWQINCCLACSPANQHKWNLHDRDTTRGIFFKPPEVFPLAGCTWCGRCCTFLF